MNSHAGAWELGVSWEDIFCVLPKLSLAFMVRQAHHERLSLKLSRLKLVARSYSSGLPSDETVQRALQSHFMTTFSLKIVKDWMSSNQLEKLPEPSPKVREHHTLGQFLSS